MKVTDFLKYFRGDRDDRRRALLEVMRRATQEYRVHLDAFEESLRPFTDSDGLHVGTTADGLEVRLPKRWAASHWLEQGATGTGKTTQKANLFAQLIPEGYCGGIDCKEGFHPLLIRLIAAHGLCLQNDAALGLRNQLYVIDPFSSYLAPLNICAPMPGYSPEVQSYEFALALARLFHGDLTAHAQSLLRHLLILLIESKLTLVEAPFVLQDEITRGVLAMRSANPAVKEFFMLSYAALPQVSKDSLLNRLQSLLLPESLRLMLGADTVVNFRTALEEGKLLSVFLGKGPSVPEEQVNVLGSLILQMILQATYARSPRRRQPYTLLIDEFTNLIEGTALAERFQTALTAARSFGLHLWLSHHSFVQVPSALRQTILANVDLVSVFRTSVDSAAAFGDFLPDVDMEEMRSALRQGRNTSKSDLRGYQIQAIQRLPNRQFFWYDRRHLHASVYLRTPDFIPPHQRLRMSEKRFEEIVEEEGWTRGAVALPREELRRQITERHRRLRELLNPPIIVEPEILKGNPKETSRGKRRPRLG